MDNKRTLQTIFIYALFGLFFVLLIYNIRSIRIYHLIVAQFMRRVNRGDTIYAQRLAALSYSNTDAAICKYAFTIRSDKSNNATKKRHKTSHFPRLYNKKRALSERADVLKEDYERYALRFRPDLLVFSGQKCEDVFNHFLLNDTMDSTEETGDTNQIGDVEETISDEQESTEEMTENQAALTMDCIEFAMEDGEPFSTFTTAESASVKEVGRGKVIVLGYSLSMEPLSSADFKQFVARFLIEHAQSKYTISKFYGNDTERSSMYAGVDVARMSDLSNKPSVILYGFILIFYIILVGPILYVILKKVNKREKIWIAIPIVTLAFTAIIYITGFMYRMNKPLVSTFTLIELEDKAKSEKIYTNIICPKPKEYRLQFAEGYTGFRSNVDEYDYNVFDNSQNESDS